jgi:hypothetical protein
MVRLHLLLLRWKIELRERLEAIWESRWSGVSITSILAVCAGYFLLAIPPPGICVAALGVAAAFMAGRTKATGAEKATWMLIISTLLVTEVLAIKKDRADQIAAEKARGAEERRHFAEIGEGIKKTLEQNGREFEATMSKENAVLGTTTEAAELSERNLASISGKDSFPCVVPQSHAASDTAIPLFIWNKGKNNLTGVELRILSEREFLSDAIFFKPPNELGTLPPTWGKPLPETVSPTLGPKGIANYQVQIWDQTGFYTEVINFRRGKYLLPWAYQYWLTKHVIINKTTTESRPVKGCSSGEWSDDLGDGKPIPKPPL